MQFITFIYKLGTSTYYGKYTCDRISDDHEGLDTIVRSVLISGLNTVRERLNLPKVRSKNIHIGILSLSTDEHIPTYSSHVEINCFDFYYKEYDNMYETYINGEKI